MSQFCAICRDYYGLNDQSPICPHEPLERPSSLNEYGWRMAPEARIQIDSSYRENDRDGIRQYLGHSNPIITAYARSKLDALDLANKILSEPQHYDTESQLDVPRLTKQQYFRPEE